MGKNLKKREAERREKKMQWAMQHQLNQSGVTEIKTETNIIPPSVATNSQIDEILQQHANEENFRMIFSSYNHNKCELHQLQKQSRSKALISLLNRITLTNSKDIAGTGIVRDNINCSGEYASLFNTIPPDVELKEAGFSGEGRLYFYTIRNFFCVVAIQCKHRN